MGKRGDVKMHGSPSSILLYFQSPPAPPHLPLFRTHLSSLQILVKSLSNPNSTFFSNHRTTKPLHYLSLTKSTSSSDLDAQLLDSNIVSKDDDDVDDVDIEIVKLGMNQRRITCRIAIIAANLETVWSILTDYERLADFIPGLAVCQLLEKQDNRVRLFQIGEQNLAFGLKFNAKGIVDCYEKDPVRTPFGQRRDIDFKMIEGDFQVFEGKWSIEEMDNESQDAITTSIEQEFQTTLTYVVDVKPKLWLPVHIVEGRLCREIKVNLLCIREQAHKAFHDNQHTC